MGRSSVSSFVLQSIGYSSERLHGRPFTHSLRVPSRLVFPGRLDPIHFGRLLPALPDLRLAALQKGHPQGLHLFPLLQKASPERLAKHKAQASGLRRTEGRLFYVIPYLTGQLDHIKILAHTSVIGPHVSFVDLPYFCSCLHLSLQKEIEQRAMSDQGAS